MSRTSGTIVAIDAGTSAVKAAVVASGGSIVAVERRPVEARRSPGIDPLAYWQVVAATIADLTEDGHVIDGVAVAGQGDGLWTLDASGQPAGAALEWNATVAADVVSRWEDDGTIDEHYRASGTVLWPGTAAALWRWLEATDPDHAARVAVAFCAKDWINYQLCGTIATDVTDATIPFLDPGTGRYDPAAFDRLDCGPLADRVPPVLASGVEIGRVTAAASAATGLTEGLPVHMGCVDVAAVVQGAGLTIPGDALAVLGTTAAAMVLNDRVETGGEPSGAVLRLPRPERYLAVYGASSGTSTIDWFCRTMACSIDELWADVRVGRPGVVLLPYLAGERAPFLAPDATGTFLGITPQTGRPDLARAVVHGVTSSLRHCLDAGLAADAVSPGGSSRALVLTGGGSASPDWCQLVADMTQRSLRVDDRPHVACSGLAAMVTGEPATVGEPTTFTPQTDLSDEYDAFVELGQQLRPVWSSMRNLSPEEGQ